MIGKMYHQGTLIGLLTVLPGSCLSVCRSHSVSLFVYDGECCSHASALCGAFPVFACPSFKLSSWSPSSHGCQTVWRHYCCILSGPSYFRKWNLKEWGVKYHWVCGRPHHVNGSIYVQKLHCYRSFPSAQRRSWWQCDERYCGWYIITASIIHVTSSCMITSCNRRLPANV